MAAVNSSGLRVSKTCSAINRRGLNVPTTAMIGNELAMRNVGILVPLSLIGTELESHSRSKLQVANHERRARDNASATPIAERIARAASFLLTISDVT